MGENTSIEWATHTFNPWRGCARVSPGCEHCYAETLSKRNPKVLGTWGVNGERVIASAAYWRAPLKWNVDAEAAGVRARVFCASLADWLEDRRDLDEPRATLFALIAATPWLEWLLLTKRIEHFEKLTPRNWLTGYAPKNIRVGVTAEDQRRADERLPRLVQLPVPNFVSVEPLLERVTIRHHLMSGPDPARCGNCGHGHGFNRCPNYGGIAGTWSPARWAAPECTSFKRVNFAIGHVIVGGESGPGARPCAIEWIESVVQQCRDAGVPVFVKQLGAYVVSEQRTAPRDHFSKPDDKRLLLAPNGEAWAWRAGLQDRKGGDCAEFPATLQVREFPTARA